MQRAFLISCVKLLLALGGVMQLVFIIFMASNLQLATDMIIKTSVPVAILSLFIVALCLFICTKPVSRNDYVTMVVWISNAILQLMLFLFALLR